jgi:redox-sensitive bicupin YhaK (pirin superfamily)
MLPDRMGLEPSHQQMDFGDELNGQLRLVGSPDGSDGSVQIHQDVLMYASRLSEGNDATHAFAPGRYGWLQVIRGTVTANGHQLNEGDGASFTDTDTLTISSSGDSELILFDLG